MSNNQKRKSMRKGTSKGKGKKIVGEHQAQFLIKDWLRRHEMSQASFGYAIGYSQSHVNQVINGKATASMRVIKLMAKQTGLPLRRLEWAYARERS